MTFITVIANELLLVVAARHVFRWDGCCNTFPLVSSAISRYSMYVKKLFQLLTLKTFSVSTHRKRQFVLTAFLLVSLLFFRAFSSKVILDIPYAAAVLEVIVYTLIFNTIVNASRIFIVFDIEFRSFLSSIALFAAALAIIFQDFIKNFLFGFAIMFTDDYEIGDYIQVGTMPRGVVKNITFSSVQLRTESGDILLVPNTLVRSQEIVNFSKLKPRRIKTEFHLLRTQFTSVDKVEKQLFQQLEKVYPGTFEMEKCRLSVRESNKDEILFTLDTSTKKASLKLKEQVNNTVQKFAVEFKSS